MKTINHHYSESYGRRLDFYIYIYFYIVGTEMVQREKVADGQVEGGERNEEVIGSKEKRQLKEKKEKVKR